MTTSWVTAGGSPVAQAVSSKTKSMIIQRMARVYHVRAGPQAVTPALSRTKNMGSKVEIRVRSCSRAAQPQWDDRNQDNLKPVFK
jgi:hypothetical protein